MSCGRLEYLTSAKLKLVGILRLIEVSINQKDRGFWACQPRSQGPLSSSLEKEEERGPSERGCMRGFPVAQSPLFSCQHEDEVAFPAVFSFSLPCGRGRKWQVLARYVVKKTLKDGENVTECSTALFSANERIGKATKRHATRASKQLQSPQTTTTPTNCPRQFLVGRLHSISSFLM